MKKKHNPKEKNEKLLILLIVLSEMIFVVSAVFLLKYYQGYRAEKALEHKLIEIRMEDQKNKDKENSEKPDEATDKESDLIDRSGLLVLNEDYLFWLSVPGTAIDYPVVQKDNSHYLSHNFMGEKSSRGAIFLDEGCRIYDDVLLIHGHHMKDGTMFGGLKAYRKADFAKEHTSLYLDFGLGDEEYRIFAAALIDLDTESHFRFYELPDEEEEKRDYIRSLERTSFWYEKETKQDEYVYNQIVILSTCEYGTANQRMIVAAVKTEQ